MSGILKFVVRRGREVVAAHLTTGALAKFYDPRRFDDDGTSLLNYVTTMACDNDLADVPPPAAVVPEGYGLVVVDIDARRCLDCQVARDLPYLSLSVDGSWEHVGEWFGRGWLGHGLVRVGSDDVVVHFPPKLTFEWLDEQRTAHDKTFPTSVIEEEYDLKQAQQRYAAALRIRIKPPGWTFETFEPAEALTLRDELQAAGFELPSEEHGRWSSWAVRRL